MGEARAERAREELDEREELEHLEQSALADAERDELDEHVDAAVEGSFPASDPPPWTLGPPSWSKRG